MQPRPYQAAAGLALDHALATRPDNPCIVIPTAGGKTPVMAWAIQKYLTNWPSTRILVLAHVRELLQQGVDKMKAIWPEAPTGIYCSALGHKETQAPITYAAIQSIHRKADLFGPFDLIFVDEAHRIPLRGETTYRNFIRDARVVCSHSRVVGWTATPYRLGGGSIVGPDYILNHIAYQIGVKELIDQGYLCKLRSKLPEREMDVSGIEVKRGEFVESQLAAAFNKDDIVGPAIAEAMVRLKGRNSVLFFCCSVAHARSVSECLLRYSIVAPVISGDMDADEREIYIREFTQGRYRALCNVNVLTEGFDAPCVDAVVMLRPTQSAAMYYQVVGRGLRLHPLKENCLILDFAGNIRRHGPIDEITVKEKGKGVAPTKVCPNCQEIISALRKECPDCGYLFEHIAEPDRAPKHEKRPDQIDVLSNPEPWDVEVVDVRVSRKAAKKNSTEMLVVTYYGKMESHSEFVLLNHEGFPRQKACAWWRARFGDPVPASVAAALPTLFSEKQLAEHLKKHTKKITCQADGKYTRVTAHFDASTPKEGMEHGNAAAA